MIQSGVLGSADRLSKLRKLRKPEAEKYKLRKRKEKQEIPKY